MTGRQLLSVEIKKILKEHPDNDNYGVNRIQMALQQKGITVGKRTVYGKCAYEKAAHGYY